MIMGERVARASRETLQISRVWVETTCLVVIASQNAGFSGLSQHKTCSVVRSI